MAPGFSMISASLNATSAELQAEYAVAAGSGDAERTRGIQAKLQHIAVHWQILGRPITVPTLPGARA
jgi:hypothetical protein